MTGVQTCALPICFPVTIEGYLKSEVEEYDQYLRGEVYGVKVFKKELDEDGDDVEIHASWGYYTEESAIEDGMSYVE